MKIILTIALTLLACNELAAGYRILGVFPLQGKSHWVMMEQLMLGLARRGHQVEVFTHFPQKKPVPNYKEYSLEGTIAGVVNNMTAKDLENFGGFSMKNFVTFAGDRICELMSFPAMLNVIKNPPKDPPYDVVITELFAAPCYIALGRNFNAPLVGVITSSFPDWLADPIGTPLNTAFMPSVFMNYPQRMTFWQRLQNTALSTFLVQSINYYAAPQKRYVKQFFDMDVEIADLYKDIALVLVNNHHSLHGIKPLSPNIIEVGGLHITEKGDELPADVQKWLDESKDGCVFVTFGSMMRIETFSESMVKAFYKSFENIAPVRVLMKIAKKEDLLPGLPKNVMIKPWFSQMKVLKHKNTKAFVTHGGLMGTQEAIHAGVPMVGIPIFGDQHINIQTYVNKKVAVSLGGIDNVTTEGLTNGLKTVLHDPTYRQNIKKLSALFNDRPMSALDTAIFYVEYIARHGNVLQSPAIHLNWFQKNLVDVYGFVIVCLLVVLYVVVFVLRKLKNLIFGRKNCCNKKSDKHVAAKKTQ